jgi:hypothetical protein
MRRLSLIMLTVIPTASVGPAAGNAGSAFVVVCTPKSAVHLSDDGSLVVEKTGGLHKEKLLIDLHTGVVRHPPQWRSSNVVAGSAERQ